MGQEADLERVCVQEQGSQRSDTKKSTESDRLREQDEVILSNGGKVGGSQHRDALNSYTDALTKPESSDGQFCTYWKRRSVIYPGPGIPHGAHARFPRCAGPQQPARI